MSIDTRTPMWRDVYLPLINANTAKPRPTIVSLDSADSNGHAQDAAKLVGGKGANLIALRRAGLPVASGFVITAAAFERFLEGCPDLAKFWRQLDEIGSDTRL